MRVSLSLRRIKEAYKKTGLKPGHCLFLSHVTQQACPLVALYVAQGKDEGEMSTRRFNIPGNARGYSKPFGQNKEFIFGFMMGVDGQKISGITPHRSPIYSRGVTHGKKIWAGLVSWQKKRERDRRYRASLR